MLKIGKYLLTNNIIAAPMAGVTDLCFRRLCSKLGAGMVVSEMVSSDPRLWQSKKSIMRTQHDAESTPKAVQIAGADPRMMAQAARYNVDKGAEIIDINMGCPAKKVCKKAAGSALLEHEDLVKEILDSVVNAVDVPVTLKIRTGPHANNINAVQIAQLAEQAGIAALAVHGRTRDQKYTGVAEYNTIRNIKQTVNIPIIANGDINNLQTAQYVLDYTQADGIMIGRAAQGNPWIFQQIAHGLANQDSLPAPSNKELENTMLEHLESLYSLYGEHLGMLIARKHIGWYCQKHNKFAELRSSFNELTSTKAQQYFIYNLFK
jgi:tRNA-dihydrouridine synthase B